MSALGTRSTPHGYPERWLEKVCIRSRAPISSLTPASEQSSAGSLLYKSRVRTEPTSFTAPQFTASIWGSLESLVDEMTVCCIKVRDPICLVAHTVHSINQQVYTLEKVLKLKKDGGTGVMFLDEAMKVGPLVYQACESNGNGSKKLLENNPTATFWTSLGRSLEKCAKDASKGNLGRHVRNAPPNKIQPRRSCRQLSVPIIQGYSA